MFELLASFLFFILAFLAVFIGLPIFFGKAIYKKASLTSSKGDAVVIAFCVGIAAMVVTYSVGSECLANSYVRSKIQKELTVSEQKTLVPTSYFCASSYTYRHDEDQKQKCIYYNGNPWFSGMVFNGECIAG